jgi:hypothetical protein
LELIVKGGDACVAIRHCRARRERVLGYGRALLAIRKEIPSNDAFNAHLKANGLIVHSHGYDVVGFQLG